MIENRFWDTTLDYIKITPKGKKSAHFAGNDDVALLDYLAWEPTAMESVAHWDAKADQPHVRLGLQVHKIIVGQIDAHREKFAGEIRAEFAVIAKEAVRRAESFKAMPKADDLIDEGDFTDMKGIFAKYFNLAGEGVTAQVSQLIGGDMPLMGEANQRWYLKMAAERVTEVSQGTKRLLADMLTVANERGYTLGDIIRGVEADGFPGLRDIVEETYKNRHECIARTELGTCCNQASLKTYDESGVVKDVFVMDGDGCDICEEVNGSTWSIEEAEGRELEHPNCMRVFSPVVE